MDFYDKGPVFVQFFIYVSHLLLFKYREEVHLLHVKL